MEHKELFFIALLVLYVFSSLLAPFSILMVENTS